MRGGRHPRLRVGGSSGLARATTTRRAAANPRPVHDRDALVSRGHAGRTGRTSMAHDRFRRFNTTGRWPNQAIDYDVSLMVRASGRSLFLGGLTGFDLEGRFHGKGDPAAQADQAMKNLQILVAEAAGS